jgi:DNA replication protein DnaC
VGTVLGVRSSVRGQKVSEIERKVMAFAEVAKQKGWSCDDPIDTSKEMSADELTSSLRFQGMPQRIIDTLQSGPKDTSALMTVKKFMDAPKEAWCLVLAGPKGCGKSTAGAYYLWDKTKLMSSAPPKSMRWWTAARVARVSGFNDHLEKMMSVPLMVIDDLGVEYLDKNGYFNHRLDELIDDRYSNYRKTIITTNLNANDFQTRYGARVADRIREGFKHGGGYVEFNEMSLRA